MSCFIRNIRSDVLAMIQEMGQFAGKHRCSFRPSWKE
jgi:hypothetical protein